MEEKPFKSKGKWSRFLVAYADRERRLMIRRFLEISGYTVEEVADGESAMAAFIRNQPDVALLDVDLPDISGYYLCSQIMKMPDAERTLTILMVPEDEEVAIDRAFEAGASDYITKPITWDKLRDGLRHLGFLVTEFKFRDQHIGPSQPGWGEVFNAVQDPILIVTPEGIITEVNPATIHVARKTREEIIGHGVCKIIHGGRLPHIKCPLEELLLTRARKIMETRLPGLFGDYLLTVSPVPDLNGEVRQIMLVARDLTKEEVRKVEAMRTGQLAAIGELAAGVAHEINNPINGIINYAQLMLDDMVPDAPQRDLLTRIIKEGERISTIIYKLLSFARESDKGNAMVSMKEVIGDSLALVGHQFQKDGIALALDLEDDLPPVRGHAQQLQQVILNLLSNCRYALNERYPGQNPGKKLRISCHAVVADGGECVRTMITDWGKGIPQGILNRLFDPFFSTKPPGEGTGLGLSISHGIVRDHKGVMRVDSVLDNYTTITVDIPVSREDNARAAAGPRP